jgi:hypothetical protein
MLDIAASVALARGAIEAQHESDPELRRVGLLMCERLVLRQRPPLPPPHVEALESFRAEELVLLPDAELCRAAHLIAARRARLSPDVSAQIAWQLLGAAALSLARARQLLGVAWLVRGAAQESEWNPSLRAATDFLLSEQHAGGLWSIASEEGVRRELDLVTSIEVLWAVSAAAALSRGQYLYSART